MLRDGLTVISETAAYLLGGEQRAVSRGFFGQVRARSNAERGDSRTWQYPGGLSR